MTGDLWGHLPTPCWVFSSFWPKQQDPPCPTSPIHLIWPQATFFCFPRLKKKKSPQRETFCWYGRGETKNGRSTKGIKTQAFKNCSEQFPWVYCIKWRVLWRLLKFKHVRIQVFLQINSRFWGAHPHILVAERWFLSRRAEHLIALLFPNLNDDKQTNYGLHTC